MKSAFRHFFSWWSAHRRGESGQQDVCALLFNVMGWLHEDLKKGFIAYAPEEDHCDTPCDIMASETICDDGFAFPITCECGWKGRTDDLILDPTNKACLCPDCATPLIGLTIKVEVESDNLHERATNLIKLADVYGVGRGSLLHMLDTIMGSME